MHVTKLSFKKLNPDQQYGNEEAGIEALPLNGQSVAECFRQMKKEVYDALGLDTPEVAAYAEEVVHHPEVVDVVREEKIEEPKEEPKTEEPAEEEKPKKTRAKAAPKPKKEKKEKAIAFNPEQEGHRDVLAELLETAAPGWADDDTKRSLALRLSRETLPGKDFLDGNGNPLDSFVALVHSGMVARADVL